MLTNFVDATNDANHYTKPSPVLSYYIGQMYEISKAFRLMCLQAQDLSSNYWHHSVDNCICKNSTISAHHQAAVQQLQKGNYMSA